MTREITNARIRELLVIASEIQCEIADKVQLDGLEAMFVALMVSEFSKQAWNPAVATLALVEAATREVTQRLKINWIDEDDLNTDLNIQPGSDSGGKPS